jgi:putative transposase
VNTLAPIVGRRRACAVLGRCRATHYRQQRPPRRPSSAEVRRDHRSCPPRALSEVERDHVVAVLDSERFCDLAPVQVWASLLDEGTYLCSVPTMYRLLRARAQVRERRRQARHPATVKPELVATAPNQVWSWDITKLRGPYKWSWFYLYVILDVFSRYAVGWAVAARETARLAEDLIAECCAVEGITPGQLTVHADRGTSMTSKTVALLLADLGITKSHSRPHVSNDNPFSESQFKTLKSGYPFRYSDHCMLWSWLDPLAASTIPARGASSWPGSPMTRLAWRTSSGSVGVMGSCARAAAQPGGGRPVTGSEHGCARSARSARRSPPGRCSPAPARR